MNTAYNMIVMCAFTEHDAFVDSMKQEIITLSSIESTFNNKILNSRSNLSKLMSNKDNQDEVQAHVKMQKKLKLIFCLNYVRNNATYGYETKAKT